MLSTVLKQVRSHPAVSIFDLLLLMLLSVNIDDSFIHSQIKPQNNFRRWLCP